MLLYYIYFAILLVVFSLGCLRFKELGNSSKVLLLLLFVTLLSEIIATFYSRSGRSNMFVYHVFMPIEFSLIALAFYLDGLKKVSLSFGLLFVVFSLTNSLFIQDFRQQFNSNAFLCYCVLLLTLGLRYLYELLQADTPKSFVQFPLFWISVAYSFYSLINLVVLGTHNSIAEKHREFAPVLGNIRFFSNYILYLLFIPAFLSRQATLSSD